MEWTLETQSGGTSAADSIAFDPSDVYRLSDLGQHFPWLASLDPYRDSRIAGEELKLAVRDIEGALARHCIEFVAEDMSARGVTVVQLRGRPELLNGLARKLTSDRIYELLLRMRVLLHEAETHNLSIRVYGT